MGHEEILRIVTVNWVIFFANVVDLCRYNGVFGLDDETGKRNRGFIIVMCIIPWT